MDLPDYARVADITAPFDLTAAELDALSWGRLVGGPAFEDENEFLANFTAHHTEELHQLFSARLAKNQEDLEQDNIALLLPDDDAPLAKRLSEIANWCRMFVTALGSSQALQDADTMARVAATLEDCRAIGNLDPRSHADYGSDEEAEVGYMELYEFLRVSILFLHTELVARDANLVK